MITKNALLVEQAKVHPVLTQTTPSSTTPARMSLKNYSKVTFLIVAKNATTVTGSAITLKQSKDVAGTGEKAVSFTQAYQNLDTAAGDTLSALAVISDTFTTNGTNSKNLLYVVEVDASMLDVANGFDCVRVGTGDATATTLTIIAVLWPARYAGAALPSAIAD